MDWIVSAEKLRIVSRSLSIAILSPRRFRTTVLTDLYDTTKDIKQAQTAAGHTTAAMTLKHYVKGRQEHTNTAAPIASVYGLEN